MTLVAVVSVAVALALAVAWLAWMQRSSLRWASDAELLEGMRKDGVDLSKPYTITFHLHFPSREVTLEAARAIVGEGYEAQVSAGQNMAASILIARKSLVPSKPELRAVRKQLVAFSRRYGGSYEGWFPPH